MIAARKKGGVVTHGNAIRVLLADALGLSLALLEGMLVLELAAHSGGDGDSSWGIELNRCEMSKVDGFDRWVVLVKVGCRKTVVKGKRIRLGARQSEADEAASRW